MLEVHLERENNYLYFSVEGHSELTTEDGVTACAAVSMLTETARDSMWSLYHKREADAIYEDFPKPGYGVMYVIKDLSKFHSFRYLCDYLWQSMQVIGKAFGLDATYSHARSSNTHAYKLIINDMERGAKEEEEDNRG